MVLAVGLATTLVPLFELKEADGLHVKLVAPLAVKVTELPAHIVEVFGVTVKFNAGLKLTVIAAVAVPQVPTAVTETVPAVAPKFTVIAFEFVGADVMVAPAGTDHV